MSRRPDVVAVIPARGGSKAVPRKNLVEVGGRPLLAWTVDAARQASSIDRVVLSTDDDEIAAVATKLGSEVPFRRPAALAADTTPMLDVVEHAIATLDLADDAVIVLLQPTSPLRRAEDVDATVAALDRRATSAVTVVEVPHSMTVTSLMTMDDDRTLHAIDGGLIGTVTRRQEKPRYVARNGPAVLATRVTTVKAGSLYGTRPVGVAMSKLSSIDVDDADDLTLVDALLRR